MQLPIIHRSPKTRPIGKCPITDDTNKSFAREGKPTNLRYIRTDDGVIQGLLTKDGITSFLRPERADLDELVYLK